MPDHQHHDHHHHDHSGHSHRQTKRPVTGLSQRDIQPRGNASAQIQLESEESSSTFGKIVDSLWDWAFGEYWWVQFKLSSTENRQRMALEAWKESELQGYIDALSEEEMLRADEYRNELGEVLDYLQQFEMMSAAGMTWEQMATAQKDWMLEQAREKAKAAAGDSDIDDAKILEAQQAAVADQSYNTTADPEDTSWASFSPQEKRRWHQRAAAAITKFVGWASSNHPELDIKASEIKPALQECEEEVAVAYVYDGICYISMTCVEAIERDPAYALSTIQHELRGHPEFDTGFSLGMELYDASAAQMDGYTQPEDGSDARYAEWSRYNYYGSEIAALMREEAYWNGSRDLNGDGEIAFDEENPLGSPLDLLGMLLGDMGSNWKPELLEAYLKSMVRRFQADPRIRPNAVQVFTAECQQVLGINPQ